MTARGSVAQRSGVFLISRVIGSAGFLVAVVVLAHGLDSTGRGAIAFVTVTALSIGAIVRLGVGDATLVMAARLPDYRRVLFSNLFLWTLGTASVGASLAALALFVAGQRRPAGIDSEEIIAIALGTVCSALVEAGYPMLLATGRVREQATITAAGPWFYAVLLLVVWISRGLTVGTAAFIWVTAQGLWAAALAFVAVRGFGFAMPDVGLLRKALGFGVQAWVGSLAYFLNARLDQLLVGILSSTRSLGAYAVAVNAAEIVLYVPAAAAQALLSAVARDTAESRAARVTLAFRGAMLATLGLCLLAAAAGPFAVPIVFGQRYTESVVPFLVLLPGAIGFTAISILSPALLLALAPKLASVGPSIALVLGIGLDLALIPVLNATGAALAASVALLTGGGATLLLYRARTHTPWATFVPGPSDLRVFRSLFAPALRSLRPRWLR